MAMFDPIYVTEVLNDILGRRVLQIILTPKDSAHPLEALDSESAGNGSDKNGKR